MRDDRVTCPICAHVRADFLIAGLPLPFNLKKTAEGWRDGGAVSVKEEEEEEKIKWQGGYEMCV